MLTNTALHSTILTSLSYVATLFAHIRKSTKYNILSNFQYNYYEANTNETLTKSSTLANYTYKNNDKHWSNKSINSSFFNRQPATTHEIIMIISYREELDNNMRSSYMMIRHFRGFHFITQVSS